MLPLLLPLLPLGSLHLAAGVRATAGLWRGGVCDVVEAICEGGGVVKGDPTCSTHALHCYWTILWRIKLVAGGRGAHRECVDCRVLIVFCYWYIDVHL